MSSYPSIHDAYGGFGDKDQTSRTQLNSKSNPSQNIKPNDNKQGQQQDNNPQNSKLPSDASYASYPVKIKCSKCHKVGVTRIQTQLGAAAWVWCVLLTPFALSGLACLCIDSCRDKVHYCTRCGTVVGKKFAKVC